MSKALKIGICIEDDFVSVVKGGRKKDKIFVQDFACSKFDPSQKSDAVVRKVLTESLLSIVDEKQLKKVNQGGTR